MQLRLGIIGLGRIVNSISTALKDSPNTIIQGVASRDINKAKKFSKENNIPYVFSSYDKLISSPYIDAVYIALPNSMHFEYSKKALQNNKSVICEKPIVTSSLELKKLIKIAKEKDLILTEALMYIYNEPFLKIKSLIQNNTIGEIKFIDATFNYSSKKFEKNDIRLSSELDGGVTNDLLYYPLSFCNSIYHTKPNYVDYINKYNSSIDITTSAILKYSNNKIAKIQSSFRLKDKDEIYIEGSDGIIQVINFFRFHQKPQIILFKKKISHFNMTYEKHRYSRQFDNLYKMIFNKEKPILKQKDILKNVETLEMLKV